jgi:N-acetylglucosamine malate deacetylase 2
VNVLAFFAHPDDETMLCGGTLALLTRQGARVHILIATRGEGGDLGVPPLCEREALGRVREGELRCAAQALGAEGLLLLDYTDPIVGPDDQLYPFTEDMDALAEELQAAIRAARADVLICHGVNGEYGHPAHRAAHQAAAQAVSALGPQAPLFYTIMGSFPDSPYPRLLNADAPAHLLIDVTPLLPQKTQAALCHQTQHDLFVRRGSEEAGRRLTVPEVILSTESLTRVWPPVENGSAPADPLADLLLQSGLAREV